MILPLQRCVLFVASPVPAAPEHFLSFLTFLSTATQI